MCLPHTNLYGDFKEVRLRAQLPVVLCGAGFGCRQNEFHMRDILYLQRHQKDYDPNRHYVNYVGTCT